MGVTAQASPTVEFAYAYMTLLDPPQDTPPDWLAPLEQLAPEWLPALRGFWANTAPGILGFSFLNMICTYGYFPDSSTERFLHDLEHRLPDILALAQAQGQHIREPDPQHRSVLEQVHREYVARLEELLDTERRMAFLGLLRAFWAYLEPDWAAEGEQQAAEASQTFQAKYAAGGDVLAALPAHHFVRFESSVVQIRQAAAQRAVHVIPLYFCKAGGFVFDIPGKVFIGYGLQTDDHHQQLAGEVAASAGQLRALADPTRLMLLTLLAQKQRFDMSVTDLAEQLGVTQPTVSGHLKLMREAGFITLEKRGQKSLYRVQVDAVKDSLLGVLERLEGRQTCEPPDGDS